MEAFKQEPATGAAIIIKCAAGLLVVAGLAVIGAGGDDAQTSAIAANKLRSQHETAAIAHSKTLYQDRHARIEPKRPGAEGGIERTSAQAADIPNEARPSTLMRTEPAPVKPLKN